MMMSVPLRRNPSFAIYSLFVLSLILNGQVRAQIAEVEKFDLVKEDSPIFIYERWITFPGKVPAVKAREVKCEFLVNTSMYNVLSILKDESRIKIWQKHVSDFKVHHQPDTSFWLEYSYHDIPWPVSDQDHFLRYDLVEKTSGQELFIAFQSVINPKLAPIENGVTRMELAGSWRMEQVAPQQVKVTYRILSMPSSIPRMFTDPVIRSNMMSTVKALTKLAEGKTGE
jgi:START domain